MAGLHVVLAETVMFDQHPAVRGANAGLRALRLPAPRVSKQQLRQDVQRRGRGAAVVRGHAHHHIIHGGLGVFDEDIEIAIALEDAGVEQFVFRRAVAPSAILRNQVDVGKRRLGILVEHFQIRVGRRGVEIIVELLDVLAMVALAVRQAEQPLLQDRVMPVPQSERQAQGLGVVGKSGDAVLPPAIGTAAGMIVRKIVPGIAMRTVVLAYRAPLALAQVRSPSFPGTGLAGALGQSALFFVHDALPRCCRLMSTTARKTSATPQAWAKQPRASNGASPSMISLT